MEYALLIYVPRDDRRFREAPPAEQEEVMAAHRKLQADTRKSGEFRGTVRLAPGDAARTVEHRGMDRLVVDGPFQETKELLAGFYLLDCEKLEDAIAYAKELPTMGEGRIEVRPVGWSSFEREPAW